MQISTLFGGILAVASLVNALPQQPIVEVQISVATESYKAVEVKSYKGPSSIASSEAKFATDSVSTMSQDVRVIKQSTSYESTIKYMEMVVIQAWAQRSPESQAMDTVFARLYSRNQDMLFAKFDIDMVPDLQEYLKITAVPTFLFYKNGQLVSSVTTTLENQLKLYLVKLRMYVD